MNIIMNRFYFFKIEKYLVFQLTVKLWPFENNFFPISNFTFLEGSKREDHIY